MKEVTLLGRGPSWVECEFKTEELWGCVTNLTTEGTGADPSISEGLKDKKYTKVFSFDGAEADVLGRVPYVAYLQESIAIAKERGIPIVSNKPYGTEPFPVREIAREFGSTYFMPTVSYMLAYALYQKYERIYVYGIDQGPRWEYQCGRPHIVFWLGVATGRKVELIIGAHSLRWSYRMGLNEFPRAFFEDEDKGCLANNIGYNQRRRLEEFMKYREYEQSTVLPGYTDPPVLRKDKPIELQEKDTIGVIMA